MIETNILFEEYVGADALRLRSGPCASTRLLSFLPGDLPSKQPAIRPTNKQARP
jgi:hypothetical protein